MDHLEHSEAFGVFPGLQSQARLNLAMSAESPSLRALVVRRRLIRYLLRLLKTAVLLLSGFGRRNNDLR